MPTSAPTEFVPSDDSGMYVAPERPFDRMKEITKHLQPVNAHGFDRARKTPDSSVIETVTPTAIRPMAEVLAEVAAACGASVAELVENDAFTAEIMATSPADIEGLTGIVRAYMPAQTAPGPRSNPAQGHVGASVAAAPRNLLQRLQLETSKHLDQPPPPGSTV